MRGQAAFRRAARAAEQARTAAGFLGLVLAPAGATAQASLSALQTRPVHMEVSLGAFDDSVLAFSRVSGLTVDRDGRMYVVQSIERVVTVLNPDGTLHQRIGRRGKGPGEFEGPGAVGWRGDTLWVMDVVQKRVSWFYQGQHVRTSPFVPLRLGLGPMIAANLATQWPMADGSLFSLVTRRFDRPAGSPENYLPIIRTSAGGGSESVVARLQESFPFRLVIEQANGVSYGSPLFSDFPLQSMSDTGERYAIVDRPFSNGTHVRIRVTVMEASGDTAYSRDFTVEAERLTDQQWNAKLQDAMARRTQQPGRPEPGFGIRELEAASRRPHHWPSATRVMLGSDSSAWIGLADLPWRADRDWVALDSRGTPLFKASLPRGFELTAASGDMLWGVWNDDLDVPHVQRYRIGKVGGR